MTRESQELQTGILNSKMMELRSALFFTESASLLKLPTHVISDVEIDEKGQIWFAIPRPVQQIEEFDKEMPAKLDFFKKGKEFYVKVRGKALLIADPAEIKDITGISEEMRERMKNDQCIAVKVQIQDAELVDNTPKPSQSWIKATSMQLSSWFF
jgi:general stress protein 26